MSRGLGDVYKRQTQGQPGCADYYASQNAKLKKYRLGLPDGAEKNAVGALIAELDKLAAG